MTPDQLLRAHSESTALSEVSRAQIWQRVDASIVVHAVPAADQLGMGAWVIGSAALGGIAGITALAWVLASRPALPEQAPILPSDSAASQVNSITPVTPLTPETRAVAPEAQVKEVAAEVAPTPEKGITPNPKVTDRRQPGLGLEAEMKLLKAAKQALDAGRPEMTLEHVARHRVEFARGQMVEDAAVLQIRALCAAGRAKEALAAGVAFERRWPTSLALEAVRKICRT